jgi:polysaccharide pyruvyl transferase WcaK-like protein
MGASPKRIGLFGLFGSGNSGNDGSLEAMLNFLRVARPDAEITCICANPGKVQSEYRVRSIRIGGEVDNGVVIRALAGFLPTRKLLQALFAFNTARKFDALIMPGTGILDDFSERFWGMPATLFGWCLSAKLWGTKVAFVSVGAGPIKHSLSRLLMKSAARMAQYRSYRDTVSKEFMDSIGFDTTADPIYPDIAFNLPSPQLSDKSQGASGPLTVGVGVMTYYGWRGDSEQGIMIYKSYIEKISRFVLWLLDNGHRVRILMGETTDQRAIDDLLQTLALKRPDYPREHVVAEPAYSLHDIMRQIVQTQIVVATRFHNIVCALKLSRLAVSIGYAKKNDVLMADMGVGEFCQHVESFDVDRLIGQFTKLLSDRATYERKMRERNVVYRERLALQERLLLEKVL